MQDRINKKVLITTTNWFYAPNGIQYRAVWGTLKGIHEAGKTLGFIPNRSHANWFVEVGGMIVMGCQVMYIVDCPDQPNTNMVKDWTTNDGEFKPYERPTGIYISES